jgi:O-antigen/teichoic acid export membrane protein
MKALLYRWLPGFGQAWFDRLEKSPLGYRLARGTFWSVAGALITRGLGLVSGVLVGRILGREEFGELGMIQSTVGVMGLFAGFGMGLAATKHIAQWKTTEPVRAGRVLAMTRASTWLASALMALIFLLLAPTLASRTLAAPHLAGPLAWGALLLLLGGVNGAQAGALAGFESFRAIARVNLLAGLLSFPLMLAGARYYGVTGAVIGLALSQGANCVLSYLAVRAEVRRHRIPVRLEGCFAEWRMFISFNLPLVLGNLALGIAGWAASALLVNQPGGYGESGVLNAAGRIRQLPEALYFMFSAPLLPLLAEAFGAGRTEQFGRLLRIGFAVSILIQVPFCLIQVAVPALTLLPFGADYQGHHVAVQWVMLQAVLAGLLGPMGSLIASIGRMRLVLQVNGLYALIFVALAWLWIPRHGAAGLAAAQVVGFFAANLLLVLLLHRELAEAFRAMAWPFVSLLVLAVGLVCILGNEWLPVFLRFILVSLVVAGATWHFARVLLRSAASQPLA